MPARREPLTLGFLGTGEVSDVLNEKLIEDQVKSARGEEVRFIFPVGEPFPLDSPMTVAYEYALDRGIPFEAVVDARAKSLSEVAENILSKAVTTSQSEATIQKLVSRLERSGNPKLLVYWNEQDDETKRAVRRAIEAEIEVRDLCDALTRLGRAPEPNKEKVDVASKDYSKADLEAMDEDEITQVAKQFGVDADAFETWEEVIDKVLEAQDGGDGGTDETEDDSSDEGAEDEESGLYTRDELEKMPIEELKEICKVNEIEVEGQRPRSKAYIEAILAAQSEGDEEEVEPEKPATAAAPAKKAAPAAVEIDLDALAKKTAQAVTKAMDERFTQLAGDLATRFEEFGRNLVTALVEQLGPKDEEEPAAAPAKVAGPVKKGVKKIARPQK